MELFRSLVLVIELLLICIVKIFEAGAYVYVKSAPLDTAVNNPFNDPLNVAGPICVRLPRFLNDDPIVKSSDAETFV
jgi:hypothetical protein